MGACSITAFRRSLRAFAACLVTIALLAAAASAAAAAFLFGMLLYRIGGLLFHLSIAATRILASVVLPALILTRALPGALRLARG